jgi:pimeloyl-ACP methyl ester carboxylesterase
MSRKRNLGLLAAAAGAIGAGVAVQRRRRNSSSEPVRPLEHDPLAALDGRDRDLVMDDGATISLTDVGPADGPAVVLIHGWVNDRRVWSDVAPQLVDAGHRVIAYDQRGHGRSVVGTDPCTIDRLGNDLAEVLEQLDLRDVVVAGHSMGGMATQAMLIDHPSQDRIHAIVLVSTGAAGVGLPPQARAMADLVLGWKRGDSFIARDALGTAIVRGAFGRSPHHEQVLACRDMLLNTPIPSRRDFVAAMNVMDLRAGLREIMVPTAIIVGTLDTLTPPARARVINAAIPGSTLEVLPGRGHMLPWEAPDEVAHLIELAFKAG